MPFMFITSIHQKLASALPSATIEIIDESADHAGHRAPGAHLAISITYAGFAGKSTLEQGTIPKVSDIAKNTTTTAKR